jgi:hypothetical protein
MKGSNHWKNREMQVNVIEDCRGNLDTYNGVVTKEERVGGKGIVVTEECQRWVQDRGRRERE